MTEAKEGLRAPHERWVHLPHGIIEGFNKDTADRGYKIMECFPRALMLSDVGDKRVKQVKVVIDKAIGAAVANLLQNGKKSVKLGYGMTDFEGDVVINFNRARGESDDLIIQNINAVMASANEILEAFDQPKLPNFSS